MCYAELAAVLGRGAATDLPSYNAAALGRRTDNNKNVRIWIEAGTITITIGSCYEVDKMQQEHALKFMYDESRPYAPLSETTLDRKGRARNFYWRTLFGEPKQPEVNNPIHLICPVPVVTREHVIAW